MLDINFLKKIHIFFSSRDGGAQSPDRDAWP
jgi:hypothetical protein